MSAASSPGGVGSVLPRGEGRGLSLLGRSVCLFLWPSWGGGEALFLCQSHSGEKSCIVCASVPLGGVCVSVVLWATRPVPQ